MLIARVMRRVRPGLDCLSNSSTVGTGRAFAVDLQPAFALLLGARGFRAAGGFPVDLAAPRLRLPVA